MKERKLYIDLLRVLAIFAIVLLHVSGYNFAKLDVHTMEWEIALMFNTFCYFGLPIFMMITGALLLDRDKPTPYLKIFSKNIFKVIMAIIIFGLLIFISLQLPDFIRKNDHSFANFFRLLWKACNWYHLWYLYMIIGIYLLIPVFQIVAKSITRQNLEIFLLILFFFIIVVPCLKRFVPEIDAFFPKKTKLAITSEWVLYLFSGYYIDKYQLTKKIKLTLYALGIIGFLIIFFGSMYISQKQDSSYNYFYTTSAPTRMFYAIGFYIFIKNNYNKIVRTEKLQKIIYQLSILSFTIYGIHDIGIKLTGRLLHLYVWSLNPLLSIPLIFIT
jgi:surface polysaccharide O-acyltransferase-like enzyme